MFRYRLAISVFALFQGLRLLVRAEGGALVARLGLGVPEARKNTIWFHAASNGELASAKPVIERLRAARPDLDLLVTCNSDTGVALARDWGLEARLAPFDIGWIVGRVIRRWQVVAHITMETEIWPNRVLACPGPVIVLGGRMSAGSAKSWGWFGSTAAHVLGKVTYLSAQESASCDRFRALGLLRRAEGPVADLKALYLPDPAQVPGPDLVRSYPRVQTWLAASTHETEEEVVIAAHLRARRDRPDLRLIIAPRHPRRTPEICGLLEKAGLTFALWSRGGGDAEVLVADTLGEMARWYALAGVVFIGGTLTDRGGHTPFEPAAFGAALVHGPDVANFRDTFARLRAADATIAISDADTLARALVDLQTPAAQDARGQAAQKALAAETDLDGLMADVLALLPER